MLSYFFISFIKEPNKITKSGFYSLNSMIGSTNDVLSLSQSQQQGLKQPPLHQNQIQQNNNNSTSSISMNSTTTGYVNQQQISNVVSSLNNLVNSHLRSKSPPSLHSPPMSPISRTPNSPKSPRQRQSLVGVNGNNNNNSNASLINSALKIVNSVSGAFVFVLFIFYHSPQNFQQFKSYSPLRKEKK